MDGPGRLDLALLVQLPGTPVHHSLVDRDLYTWVMDMGEGPSAVDNALYLIGLDTGSVERVGARTGLPLIVVGTRVLVFVDGGVEFRDLLSDVRLWRFDIARPAHAAGELDCTAEVAGANIILACAGVAPAESTPELASLTRRQLSEGQVVALDMATGRVAWGFALGQSDTAAATPADSSWGVYYTTLAVGAGMVYAYSRESNVVGGEVTVNGASRGSFENRYTLRAFDAETGVLRWARSSTPYQAADFEIASNRPFGAQGLGFIGGAPLATSTSVFIRLDEILALNPATGAPVWSADVGATDRTAIHGTLSMGLDGETLVAATAQSLYLLDRRTGAPRGGIDLPESNVSFSVGIAPTRPGLVYVTLTPLDAAATIIAIYDTRTGGELDRFRLDSAFGTTTWSHAVDPVGAGVAILSVSDGSVAILGVTGASLGPLRVDLDAYPPLGRPWTFRVEPGLPGLHGPATRYRVDWGDGASADWQSSPVFEHTYFGQPEKDLRVFQSNDMQQTRSQVVVLHVGESAPNFISVAFSPEKQEATFFFIGLAVTGGGALIGLLAVRQKRGRLQKEIAAVDALVRQHEGDPNACDMALRERHVRSRALVVDGKLDEAQSNVLDRHIAEHARRMRMSEVATDLDFLPHRILRTLREALQDGRLNRIERDHLVRLVDEDLVLTAELKARTRTLVERWYEGDRV